MENIYQLIHESTKDLWEAEAYCSLLDAYASHYENLLGKWKLEEVEAHLTIDLQLDGYQAHGYVDKLLISPKKRRFILDHKTTKEDIQDPKAYYWARLKTDPQSSMYKILCLEANPPLDIDGILWDVVRKPSLRPAAVSKNELEALDNDLVYKGIDVSYLDGHDIASKLIEETGESYANGAPKYRESPTGFGIRVFHHIMSNPDKYFQLQTISRNDDECLEQLDSMDEFAHLIDHAYKIGAWPQNLNNCFGYNRQCEYYDVCHGASDIDMDDFVDKDGDGTFRRVSHSSLKEFCTCPRKFFYGYVCRRVPRDMDESEPLRIGSMWHSVMDLLYREKCGKPVKSKGD